MMQKKKLKGRRCWRCKRKLPKAGYRRSPFYTYSETCDIIADVKMRDVHGSCLKRALEGTY